MFTLVLLAVLNGQPIVTGNKVGLTEEQCISEGEKMEKDIAKITEGRAKLLWKCLNGTEKTL